MAMGYEPWAISSQPMAHSRYLQLKFLSEILSACVFHLFLHSLKMVAVAQLVRASDCGSEGRRFEPG